MGFTFRLSGVVALSLFIFQANAETFPQSLLGDYKLSKGVFGMCDSWKYVQTEPSPGGGTTVLVGDYIFPRVNKGTWETRDSVTHDTRVTTFDGRILKFVAHSKPHSGQGVRTIAEASFNRGGMTFRYRFYHPEYRTNTECRYVKAIQPN